MVKIEVKISTNASESEKQELDIPGDAIAEFLGFGFCEGKFEGSVVYYCPPRAISPDYLQIFITITDFAEIVIVWATIISALIKFCKKCKGYKPTLVIRRKDKNDVFIPFNANQDCEEVIKKIKDLLK